jgi:hypothetical protein
MAGLSWLPAAIAALPHVTDLVKASKDLLKNRKNSTPALDVSTIDANDPLARVAAACANNTESIRLLTEQMQNQLEHYQTNAQMLQKRLRRMTLISVAAIVIAVIAVARSANLI